MRQQGTVTQEPAPMAAPGFRGRNRGSGTARIGRIAGTTFFLSMVNSGILPKGIEPGVLGLAFFYGGLAQLLAGMWEFTKGNTFGATAFSSFGAFWLSFWYLVTKVAPTLDASVAGKTVGTFLLVWTIFTLYMSIAALRTTGAILSVFVALTLTFLFLTIGAYGASAGMTKVGGYLGLLTALLAWYTSLAGVVNGTFKRPVLPVFPR